MIVARFAAVGQVQVDAALTDAERVRHDRLRFPADRDAYRAAHLLVRECAAELLNRRPAAVRLEQRCPRCGGDGHGRPSVAGEPGVRVSLSHTRGFVAAVAATAVCGVDVETIATSIPRLAVSEPEAAWLDGRPEPLPAFTRLWVRKEALVKAGLAPDPASVDVLAPVADFTLTDWSAPAPDGVQPPALGCLAVAAPPVRR